VTKALYLEDSYQRECDAIVVSVKDGKYVVLNQTIFYPKGGGQPWDTGKIMKGTETYNVVYVGKFSGEISHEASLLCTGTGALVTGNQLEEDKIRFDFSLEKYDREILNKYIDKANDWFRKDTPVRWYELPKKEAMSIPGVIKMAEALPPDIPNLRIVEIVGVDIQADGGTHVKNLKEVGQIELLKTKNKGKSNRRVYFTLT